MSNAVLDRLREERDEARSAAVALAESDNFNPEDETYVSLKTRAEKLDARVSELADLFEARKTSDALDGKLSKVAKRTEGRSPVTTEARQSFGELFTRSEAFQEYAGSPRGRMPAVDAEMQTRALPTSLGDLTAAGLTPDAFRVNTTAPQQPTPLLDNISRIQVSSNAVEYVSWSKVAGGAAVVAEGAAKPSAEFAPEVVADSLDNIAVYTQLTRQLIEDESAVRSLIDEELIRDVRRKEEAQVAAALTAAALPTHVEPLGGDLLAGIRAGIGVVQSAGYTPNALLLNPADWADLDNVVMSSTLNGPTIRQNFWGLVPIPSTAQAEGTAVVGDFRAGVSQFFRSNVSLYISDSHADTFLLNVFTLLAERRSLAAVVRPQSLVEVSVAAA
jgi:hypothetical protein